MKLRTYLNFAGCCEEAIQYYQAHLGATGVFMMRFSQMPDPSQAPPGMGDKVLHARFQIADAELLASDVPQAEPLRSAYLTLSVSSNEEAERIYNALADGGQILMALEETFFAHRYGQVRDRFGMNWMVLHERAM
ncbi:MAG: VOC family protein [Acidobacteriota bacterium]|nr:VOC family protein [Acidobacteriota bacterium]